MIRQDGSKESVSVEREIRDAVDPGDLAAILEAWQSATDRLQRTHETLRTEVRRLTDELEAKNRELARRNRLADLGQMASHVAHEVRNGIVPLKLYLGLLGRQVTGRAALETLIDRLASGFSNLESTVDDLLTFASDREAQCESFSCRELIEGVLEELAPHLRAHDVRVDESELADVKWVGDVSLLRRAVVNLILNAVDVMVDGGELTVVSLQTPRGLEIEIGDSGPGISESIASKLFEPFFSTKATGTGLGLALVERVAAAHGGGVEARNAPEGGAAFTLWIPERSPMSAELETEIHSFSFHQRVRQDRSRVTSVRHAA